MTGFIFANDDQFAKINPRENLYSRKLILAKIYTFKVIDSGKKTLEIMKAEEEKKIEILRKKTTNLENKVKKKDEEINELKNLMKLKQTTFM